jgi:hypothetical protein
MGVRFACHACGKQLNIKRELAGRRGVCPACGTKFRIPSEDAESSLPIDTSAGEQEVLRPGNGAAVARLPAAGSRSVAAGDTAVAAAPSVSPEQAFAQVPQAARGPVESISILDDDDEDAAWYVRPPSGGQYGPASGPILRQWIDEGRVAATALLWRDGWPQWRDASEALPELAHRLPGRNASSRFQGDEATDGEDSATMAARVSGRAGVGTTRRARSTQRILWIVLLTVLAVALVAVLLFLMNRPAA